MTFATISIQAFVVVHGKLPGQTERVFTANIEAKGVYTRVAPAPLAARQTCLSSHSDVCCIPVHHAIQDRRTSIQVRKKRINTFLVFLLLF